MIIMRCGRWSGCDTHVDTHTAALCDGRGRPLASCRVPDHAGRICGMAAWAQRAAGDTPVVWAVEGTRHYGLGLSRYWPARASGWSRSTAAGI